MSKSLIIDPGHGGKDPGAIGGGIKEKDWSLDMSIYQYKRLKELDATVALTRQTDVGLTSVVRTAKIKNKYDYCMSNHFNSVADTSVRGVEVIRSIYSDDIIAQGLADVICSASGLPFRRIISKANSKNQDWYYMQRLTGNTKTVNVEYGFLSNAKDRAYYKNENNFYTVAEAVVRYWCKILEVEYKPLKNSTDILYLVQVGAFTYEENADRLADELKKLGYSPFVVKSVTI